MSFNVDAVRNAWEQQNRAARKLVRDARLAAGESWQSVDDDTIDLYSYVKEIWSDFVIVDGENTRKTNVFFKIPFSVDEKTQGVTFGKRQPVKQEYVALSGEGELLWATSEGPAVNRLKLLVEEV